MADEMTVATKATAGEDEPIEFTLDKLLDLDGEPVPLAAKEPGAGQLLFMQTLAYARDPDPRDMNRVINMVLSLLTEPDMRDEMMDALAEGRDGFDIDDFMEALEKIIEAFAGRPTKSASDSSRSRGTGGQKSTGPVRKKASTSRRSGTTSSSTSSSRGQSKESRTGDGSSSS